ncbi:MAG: AbrB/MazE/SpoVT family DNA-binding domain-containing protein [Candidatus Njordarchaeia archaeon]
MKAEIKKVDKYGRIVLPAKWRKKMLKETQTVIVIDKGNELKIVPITTIDLKKYFDKIDLGVESIGDWKEFEKKILEKYRG